MAFVDIEIYTYTEGALKQFYTTTNTNLTVVQGDTLRFTYRSDSTPASVTAYNFASGRYASTANISLAVGNVKTLGVLSNATTGNTVFYISAAGYSNIITINVNLVSSSDTTPDDVTFVTIAGNPGEVLESNTVRITGINTPISVNCVGGTFFKSTGGAPAANGTAVNGDYITLVKTAPANYNSSASMTVTLGSISRTWTVQTFADPGSGQVIPFPVQSGSAITLEQVLDFFGGDDVYLNPGRPNNMRSYFKGGSYVPNIAKNANIPEFSAGATLRLSNFIGSGTALYFLKSPGFRSGRLNTISGGGTVFIYWSFTENRPGDPKIGFGPITFSCQYRYRVRQTSGPTVTTNRGPLGSWSAWDNLATLVSVSYVTGQNTEVTCQGEVDFEVRSTYAPTVVLSATASFDLYAFGP